MDIYAYHLEHPQESQWHVSLAFGVSKGTVWNAYRFMAEGIAHDFVVAHVPKNPYLCTVNEKLVHPLREYVLNCRPYDDTQPVDG